MIVKFTPNDKNNPPGKLADADCEHHLEEPVPPALAQIHVVPEPEENSAGGPHAAGF